MSHKRARRKLAEAGMPLSSMIDIVFLLLIYFIVTQNVIRVETSFSTDTPRPDPGGGHGSLLTIDVGLIHPENPALDLQVYKVNGRRWQFADLKPMLDNLGANDPELTVVITCDPNAKHAKLIRLLDACHDAKLSKFNLFNQDGTPFRPERYREYYRAGAGG